MQLTATFTRFFQSEKSGSVLLLICTLISLGVANSPWGTSYLALWQTPIAGMSLSHWINDGLMAIFFLLIGLELERELYVGELSNLRNAILPILAALGGVLVPASLHYLFNAGTPSQSGFGIPMATDIAFALGALALLGDRVPNSLKVFLVALAVIDDLIAIMVIALFYSTGLNVPYLLGALATLLCLIALNRVGRVMHLAPYLLGGALMWFLMLKSGVHATIAGVLLAFAIPFSARRPDEASPSHRLEARLHLPVTALVLPLFALANTGVAIGANWSDQLFSNNSLGIVLGLVLGKPVGIFLASWLAIRSGLCRLPESARWPHVLGAGCLGGIGFTMSIFIANLAFPTSPETVDAAKLAILIGSLCSGLLGYSLLSRLGKVREG